MGINRLIVLLGLLAVSALPACMSFDEVHYFQSVGKKGSKAPNFYRLTVNGSSQLSLARYAAGFYDERAVDMYFNELKPASAATNGESIRPVFVDDQTDPGTGNKITPLSTTDENGAFVMLLSTNAKSVLDTIGNFAESQVVAQAITNLVNEKEIKDARELDARLAEMQKGATAVVGTLDALFGQLDPESPPPTKELETAYLRIMDEIAKEIDGNARPFESFGEARSWFGAKAGGGGGAQ